MSIKTFLKSCVAIKTRALLMKQLGSTKANSIKETLPSIEKLSLEDKQELKTLGEIHNYVVPFAFRLKAGSLGNKLFRTDTEFTKKMGKIFSYPGAVLGFFTPSALLASILPMPIATILAFIYAVNESDNENCISAGTMAGYAVGSNLGYALSKAEEGISNAYHTIASKLSRNPA